jgi:S-formylglutathione hydrolase FrmB
MVVIPDGGFSSWYFDSPIMPQYRYETFVTKELVPAIDDKYKTLADRKGRAITGNSMGGHGAFYLAIRHQDLFGSVGSMSGGVDIRPFPENWHIAKRLGTKEEYPENWENNTVINMTHLIKPGLNIIFDCGTGDFFYEVNCNLHDKLLEAEIPHDFYVRPGQHNWVYWYNAVKYQFQFFSDRFGK